MMQFIPPAQRPLEAPNLCVRDMQKIIMAAVLWAKLIIKRTLSFPSECLGSHCSLL